MDNTNDRYSIITSAEQLVAELWEAKKAEASQVVEEDAPSCPEAAEDEAGRIEAFAKALAAETFEGLKSFTVVGIDRCDHDDLIPLVVYDVKGIIEFNCGKCDEIHKSPARFSAIRMSKHGPLYPLESETILDRSKEIMGRRRQNGGPQVAHMDLDDFVDGIAGRLQAKMAEKSGGGPGDGDDDDLPPAAIAQEPTPAITIDEHEEQPSLLRRAWNRLRRR